MNEELLAVLDHIEKEKGISKEIVTGAIESALVSAVRKALGEKTEDVSVKFDIETGDIKIFSGGKEVQSPEFGRIAAQTAKQVIIQKIREAERDVIFKEFQTKLGTITSGTAHRFEKGMIIVDLGKVEGVMPRHEQVPKERYKQGERIRALILDVDRTNRGPRVILSRTHPNFVKKLFELEVPEIYESIVEVKSISREPGERTKIAVYSRDDKVDCVGACVGMRGSRVKDIVRELRGEKIDIVRWSEEAKEYIAAALSPAKIVDMVIDRENKKARVMVEDDQLSLAIGKRGQNVRLAVKLTGWDIDIKGMGQIDKEKEKVRVKLRAEKKTAEKGASILELPKVGLKLRDALTGAGFGTIEAIAGAALEQLTQIKGIGKKSAEQMIEGAKKLLEKSDNI